MSEEFVSVDRFTVFPEGWSLRYHVPRSQVWEGSRGRAAGQVHLHLPLVPSGEVSFTAVTGRRTSIARRAGQALCGKPRGWYERDAGTDRDLCPRCVATAARYGIAVPDFP